MSRKIRFEEQSNHDRWVVSYADFVTLLFAFFVVMYSISSVNEDKYRVLSNAMLSAFNDVPLDLRVQQGGALVDKPLFGKTRYSNYPRTMWWCRCAHSLRKGGRPRCAAKNRGKALSNAGRCRAGGACTHPASRKAHAAHDRKRADQPEAQQILAGGGNQVQPAVRERQQCVNSLFGTLLLDLADMFVDLPNRIHVEGFTDDQPIRTPVFPSNWELSAARAAAVVRLFERHGIDPVEWPLLAMARTSR